jgi:hypothetical protein
MRLDLVMDSRLKLGLRLELMLELWLELFFERKAILAFLKYS